MADLAFIDFRDWLLSDPDIASALGYAGGVKPFWPAQEQPESTRPYIIYNTRLINDVEEWWMEQEQVSMVIYGTSLGNAWSLFRLIQERSNRGEESVRPLNRWLKMQGRDDWRFHSVEYITGGDIGVSNEEGASNPVFITVRYKYSPAQT